MQQTVKEMGVGVGVGVVRILIGQEAWPAFSAVASPQSRYASVTIPWETLLDALKIEMRLALVLQSKRGSN